MKTPGRGQVWSGPAAQCLQMRLLKETKKGGPKRSNQSMKYAELSAVVLGAPLERGKAADRATEANLKEEDLEF
jgi:hypothetical protein